MTVSISSHFIIDKLISISVSFPLVCWSLHLSVPSGLNIYYSAWADQRRHVGSYIAYTPRSCDCREYIAESGVYISTAGSILLSQWCIFGNSQLQHRETEFFLFLQWNGQFSPSPHYRRATASTIEPPYSVLAQ